MRKRTALNSVAAFAAALALAGTAAPAHGADRDVRLSAAAPVAPGVDYRSFTFPASHGSVTGHLVTVDLADSHVRTDLLYPGAVGARSPVSGMANARGAVAAVNGDFFNIDESQHPGVEATGAPVGPAIAAARHLKAAVPNSQRFGPALPPGDTTEDVIGVGVDRTARLDRLKLRGAALTPDGTLPLAGLNQYALAEGGIGAFTAKWGSTSRVRATCGSDARRGDPCSTDTHEVTVRRGRVVATADTPGRGPIAADTTVLVGREAGAQQLRKLSLGEPVAVSHHLEAVSRVPYAFAVGGYPIRRGGAPLPGLDTVAAAARTSAGIGDSGHRLYLLALDGNAETSAGLTIAELADLMGELGATDAVNLDGGGSSTLAVRDPGAASVTVKNRPPGSFERPVPNGIGVFSSGQAG
ncbi:phosphodiester glycosidase family protein [Streptomyces sp. A7024]|uniref:Phosphodiester glycosidase family protein n=1 Tax=Streptomyces coryli TaxID=1128680 RepID=A0A6G4TVG6_9ACTN|nr:phosphodiester glycosidase family protein [Streptomyces coryli]NGN63108.1 phosphodiester glycosidase family protein [Streptomyces coryli]